MNKAHLITAIKHHARMIEGDKTGIRRPLGMLVLLEYLDWYFQNLDIPQERAFPYWDIRMHTPVLFLNALQHFHDGEDGTTVRLRAEWENECCEPFPDPTRLGPDTNVHMQSIIRNEACLLLRELIDSYPRAEEGLDALLSAERTMLTLAMTRFMREVHAKGMFDLVDSADSRRSGHFPSVTVLSLMTAGNLMYTFRSRTRASRDETVSFVCEDTDRLGITAGVQSVHTDLRHALDMIDDVIDHWPTEKSAQTNVFSIDTKVSII